jgi:hypothetical protein
MRRTRRPFYRAASRSSRVLLVVIGAATGMIFLAGAAFAYWVTTDSSNPAQAAAATLSAPTAGTPHDTATPSAVPIKWTAPTGYTPTGYTVLRCTGSSCTDFIAISNGTCSGAVSAMRCTDTDSGLAAGTTYSYEVEADLDNWVSAPGSSFTAATSTVNSLAFTGQPSSGQNIKATGTGTFAVSVAIEDASGNVATDDDTDTLTLAIATGHDPGSGTLSCTGGLTATVSSGVASFTGCAITSAGDGYELTASSATNTFLSAPANANSFDITAGTFAQFGVGVAATAAAGTAVTGVTLTAEDADSNTVTSYSASNKAITWSGPTSSPNTTAPTLPAGTVSFTAGVSTTPLSATYTDAGTQTLTATDGTSRTGSATTTVSAGTFTQYGVGAAATATAGTTVTGVTLTAEDADGNTVTSYTSPSQPITWSGPTSSPNTTAPTLPAGTVSFTAGVSTTPLSATYTDAGTQTLTATDETSRTGSATTTVNGTAPASLVLANCVVNSTTQACNGPYSLGHDGTLVADVQTLDQYGNAATITSTVRMSTAGGGPKYSVTPATLKIDGTATPPNQSTLTFTVTQVTASPPSATITIHVTSSQSIPDLTFTVQNLSS